MTITRIFFLSSLFIVCTSLSSSEDTHDESVLEWQQTYLTAMSPEQLQFTANFLYLSCAIAIAEIKIRQFITPLSRLNHAIKTKVITYKDATEDIAMLKTLLDRLSYVAGARTIYMETLNVCIKYHNNQLVDSALGCIQHDAQKKLSAWAYEMLDETNARLAKSSENFSLTSQYFQSVSQLYKNMSKGILPIKLPKEQEQHKLIIIFDAIMRNNNELLMLAEQGIDTINETSDYAAKLISAGAEIYKQYYNIIYEMIMTSTFDKRYATTMFSMHDVLPEEYKSLLPDPHHVFEHMLQTTKLYTQTELL